MVKYEDECCDCAVPGYPCLGDTCHRRRVPHFYCDDCGEEKKLYEYDGKQLCDDCLVKNFDIVEGSDGV